MSEAVARLAGAHDGTWIGVSPFAQHEGKIYPLDKMREVMLRLARIPGARIFVFGGGDAEKAYAEEVAALRDNIVSVIGRIRLGQEMELISNLDLMVSMDSSGLHMSSLVGLPVVSVWGATHPFAGFYGFGQGPALAVASRYAVPALFGVWQQTLPVRRLPVYASDYARDDRKPGMRSVGRGNTLRECGLEKLLKQRFGRRPRFVSRQSYFWAYRGSPSTGPTPGKR